MGNTYLKFNTLSQYLTLQLSMQNLSWDDGYEEVYISDFTDFDLFLMVLLWDHP